MTESQIAKLLLELAVLFVAAYLLGAGLARLRIPPILAALFVGMAAHFTFFGDELSSGAAADTFTVLAELGVLMLLFFIGSEVDIAEMRRSSGDIVWVTVLNTLIPFFLGIAVMLLFDYGWIVIFVVAMTRMPTAEAVVVPILDEFDMVATRVGRFVIGAGVLDDVIEVFLVAFVSVWIGTGSAGGDVLRVGVGLAVFATLTVAAHRWILPWLDGILPRRPRNLMLLAILTLFALGGVADAADLGLVVGAITAGALMRPVFARAGTVGAGVDQTFRSIAYGFLGPVFFFWVGIHADLSGIVRAPELTILLFLAAFAGKLAGVWLMVPMGRISGREAWAIGIGLNSRLTTELIVAQLLLAASLIDVRLFTALVAASSLSTVLVPPLFAVLLRRWGGDLRQSAER